jgi:hypothetical protein
MQRVYAMCSMCAPCGSVEHEVLPPANRQSRIRRYILTAEFKPLMKSLRRLKEAKREDGYVHERAGQNVILQTSLKLFKQSRKRGFLLHMLRTTSLEFDFETGTAKIQYSWEILRCISSIFPSTSFLMTRRHKWSSILSRRFANMA